MRFVVLSPFAISVTSGAIISGTYGMSETDGVRDLSSYNGAHNGAYNGAFSGTFSASTEATVATRNYNAFFLPEHFGPSVLGSKNAIDPSLLLPAGVGDLSKVSELGGNNVLDNRHISSSMKEMLCLENDGNDTASFRDYFGLLISLAWPDTAEFHLCCSEPAGVEAVSACVDPDYTFSSDTGIPDVPPLALAPHFLTVKFETGQQEALSAGLIAKLNVHGKRLWMDLGGRFDLGEAGTKLITRKSPKVNTHNLGSAWGNMFLDCLGPDQDHVLCQASLEQDRVLGRDPKYHGAALFTCNGESVYPTKISGKSCFSEDMATNAADGCGLIAAVGNCDEYCVGGLCGVNEPVIEGRGSMNVLSIYMGDYEIIELSKVDDGNSVLKIVLPIVGGIVVLLAVVMIVLVRRRRITPAYTLAEDKDSSSHGSNGKTDLVEDDEKTTMAEDEELDEVPV